MTSGMGMHLLKKMGWAPGEGLGKDRNGGLMPLLLELKLDKRGLEANEEVRIFNLKINVNDLNKKLLRRFCDKEKEIKAEASEAEQEINVAMEEEEEENRHQFQWIVYSKNILYRYLASWHQNDVGVHQIINLFTNTDQLMLKISFLK